METISGLVIAAMIILLFGTWGYMPLPHTTGKSLKKTRNESKKIRTLTSRKDDKWSGYQKKP